MISNFNKYQLNNDYQFETPANYSTYYHSNMPSGGGNSILTSATAPNNNKFKHFRPTKIDE